MVRILRDEIIAIALACMIGSTNAAELERVEAQDGNSFIAISGSFLPTESLDQELSREVARRSVAFVTFNSPGGSPYAAMRLGRTIRQLGLNTTQIKAAECSSACTLAFLGGLNRFAEAGSLGVHKASFVNPDAFGSQDAVSLIQAMTGDIIGYLIEMGVDPSLMQLALAYDADDMRYLSASEMAKFGVTTNLSVPPREQVATASSSRNLALPESHPDLLHGWVRHPSGGIVLKSAPDEKSDDVAPAWNATPVAILATEGHWLKIRCADNVGYAHETWIKVDGYASSTDDRKFVQIFSFPDMEAAQRKMQALSYKTDAYETPGGWIAVTLAGKFADDDAKALLARKKKETSLPNDSFRTFGNIYKKKICCD